LPVKKWVLSAGAQVERDNDGVPLLIVHGRRRLPDPWMTWVDGQVTGDVRSYDEVLAKAEQHRCDLRSIYWLDFAYEQMATAGVAPASPPLEFVRRLF
jgi:hypothetical protein